MISTVGAFVSALRDRGLDIPQLAALLETSNVGVWRLLLDQSPDVKLWPRLCASVSEEEWALIDQLPHVADWVQAQRAQGSDAWVWLMRKQCSKCPTCYGFSPCVERQTHRVTHGLCPACYRIEYQKYPAHIAACLPQPQP